MRRPAAIWLISFASLSTGAARAQAPASAPAACTEMVPAAGTAGIDALQALAARCARESGPNATASVQSDLAYVHGRIADRRGRPIEAIAHHERELQIARDAGLTLIMRRAYDRLAEVSRTQAEPARYFEYAERAFTLTPNPAGRDRALYLLRTGAVYDEFQDIERADRSLSEAYALSTAIGDAVLTARILNAWAIVYLRTDIDPPRSLRYCDEGLRLLEGRTERDAMTVRSSLLNTSGNVFRDNPATGGEALRRYRESLAISKQQNLTYSVVEKNIGRVLRIQGRHEESERTLIAAVRRADEEGVIRARWQARMELGALLMERDADRAERFLRAALDILEAAHGNALLENYQAGALGGDLNMYDNPYDLLVTLLVRGRRASDAFVVAERARARAFLDTLAGTRETIAAQVPDSFVRDESALLRRISDGQAALRATGLAAEARRAAEAAIRGDEDRLADLRVRLAADRPAVAHARFPRMPAPEHLQRTVGPDEALLEYFAGAESSMLWVIRQDGVSTFTLPPRRELDAAVTAFVDAISVPDREHAAGGRALMRLLVDPARARLQGVRRLTIAPDGILHYLPFEALLDESGRYLIQSFTLSYVPSAASLAYLRARPPRAPGGVVAIGNPVLQTTGAAQERSAPIGQVRLLKPLPHAREELASLARAYPAARILEQASATEVDLQTVALDRAAILHFATHGVIDEDAPQRSGLALTLAPGSDGILQMREIYGLRLQAGLVTLSACQTALGKGVTGEGIVGLTRAFLHAGAGAVVASLWNVNDASTAAFMARFYRELGAGRPIDEAMAAAKRDFLAGEERWRHPFFWSAFVVTGHSSIAVAVVTPFWSPARLAIAAAVLVLAAAGLRAVSVNRG